MSQSPKITVVGSINMDLVFRTPRIPAIGETISGHEFVQIAGGKGANQAVAAARQGASTMMIGCVGDDTYGQQSINGLRSAQIDTSHISTIPQCATGVAGILVDDRGQNSIVIAPGANARLTPLHIQHAAAAIIGAQLVICQCETPLNTIAAAINLAHEHGVKVVFNPAPVIDLPLALFSKIDYLVVNETEATQLSQIQVTDFPSAQNAAQQLLKLGIKCVLLTMGEHGVWLAQQHQASQHFPAIRVHAIDTTAAGDTFIGAFACAIGSGMVITDAIQHAQDCAALAVTKLGAQSSIPTRSEVEQFKADRLPT